MDELNPYLPPIYEITSQEQYGAHMYLSQLAQESRDAMAKWVKIATDSVYIYTYGDSNYGDEHLIICNEIQNAVIAAVDIQTKEPPTVGLNPIETGEPGEFYFVGDESIAASLKIPPETVLPSYLPTGEVVPPAPIPPAIGNQLLQMRDQGLIDPDSVVEVNDQLVSDTLQTVFDVYWLRSSGDRIMRSYLLRTNIEGFAFILYEWDDGERKPIFRPMSMKQVHIDPTVEDIADAQYAGIDLIIDAEEASRLYPHLADEIMKSASDGTPYQYEGMTPGEAFNRQFNRKMVTLRTFWLRNQLVSMSPEEAMESGEVEEREVETGEMMPATDELGNPQVDELGQAIATPVTRKGMFRGDEEVSPAVTGEDGMTAPHPNWPMRRGLRQITLIEAVVVDDRECEHWEIPILHNVNIPIPGRPYGLGEPFRLKKLQEARNSMMSAIVEHTNYYRYPATAMSQSMANSLPEEFKDVGVVPGLNLTVPDVQWQLSGGKITTVIQPPELTPAVVEAQQFVKQEMTEISGHTNEVRGISSGDKSGRAIELLQTAATSLIGFKSQRTGDVVYRAARLLLHCLVWRLPLSDLKRIISKYPDHVLAEIQKRARNFEWDVKVTVASGSGMQVAQKKQEALQQLQLGLISLETASEIMGIDYRQERQRMQGQMAQQAAMMPQTQPQPSEATA